MVGRRYLLLVVLLCIVDLHVSAKEDNTMPNDSTQMGYRLLPDSSNFVTVSFLVASPGEEGYSSLGHCALRMECPIHKLDYCFTFESLGETPWFNYFAFLTGNMPAGFQVWPTDIYLRPFQENGRGVVQYTLQLKLHEEQELWRFLDTDWEQGQYRMFDFVRNNCTSVCMMAVENIMWQVEGEKIDIDEWPKPMCFDNGHGIQFLTRNNPWMQFFLMALIGTEAEQYWPQFERLSPELIGDVLMHASVTDVDGNVRTFVEGKPVELLKQTFIPKPSFFTPTRVALVLLLLALLVSLGECFSQWRFVTKWFDGLLLLFQTLAGCFLLYISFVSCILGLHWNWLLLLFNPLPIVLWLLFHRCVWFHKIYLFYFSFLILITFLGNFFSSQFILPYRLIALSFAIRCLSVYIKNVKL